MKHFIHFLKQYRWFILYTILVTLLLYTRDIIDIPINKYIFVIICIGFSFIVKYYELISIITFTLPLMCGLPSNYLLPIWCVLVAWNQIKHRTIYSPALFFVLLFSIWEILISSFYPVEIQIPNYIGYISSLMLLCLLSAEKSHSDITYSVVAFLIGCCVLLILIYMAYIKDPTLMIIDGGRRMGGVSYTEEGVMSLKANANSVGLISATAISISLTLFYYKKLRLFPFILTVISCFYCGLFAVSRTWAILVFLCFLLYFIFQRENKKMGYLMLFVLIIGVVFFLSQNGAILQVFEERFLEDDIESAGGRTGIFEDYNNYLFNNPFNLLCGTSALLYKEVTGLSHSTHNGMQQILVSYGIIGFFIFMYAYVSQIKAYYVKRHYMACLPMLITFLFLQTLQVLNPYYGLYPVIASFLVMRLINAESHYKN